MARFKAAKGGKKDAKSPVLGALPCLVVILGGMALLFFLFNAMMKSGG